MHRTMNCPGNWYSRRGFLAQGVAGGLGLTLADLLFLRSRRAAANQDDAATPPAQSLIHIFLPGGVPQQETFDPKPYAPSNIVAIWGM